MGYAVDDAPEVAGFVDDEADVVEASLDVPEDDSVEDPVDPEVAEDDGAGALEDEPDDEEPARESVR